MWLLAQEIVRVGGPRYRRVDLEVLSEAVFEHDTMKTTTDKSLLRRFGFDQTVAHHLVELWGRPASTAKGLDNSAAADLLRKMNRGDKHLESRFPQIIREIVSLADAIDKGSDPITAEEELGRRALKASLYLGDPEGQAYQPRLAALATKLEKRYHSIVPSHLLSTGYRKHRRTIQAIVDQNATSSGAAAAR